MNDEQRKWFESLTRQDNIDTSTVYCTCGQAITWGGTDYIRLDNWITGHFISCRRKHNITFEKELTELLNKYSKENESNTPDFILAKYLIDCLNAYNKAEQTRYKWFTS